MLKKTLIISFIIVTNIVVSQHKYEAFVINEKIGIVEINTLEEFILPIYEYNKRVNINIDYITFRDNDSLRIFNKKNGKWSTPIKLSSYSSTIKIGTTTYLNAIKNNKSALLDSLFRNKFQLKKLYVEIRNLGDDFIYAKLDNTIDLFKKKKQKLKLKHSLNATDYAMKMQYPTDGSKAQEVIAFYGGSTTYLFDKNYNLIKTFEKEIKNEGFLNNLINPISRTFSASGNGPDYVQRAKNTAEFMEVEPSNTAKKQFTSTISSFNVLTNSDYDVRSDDSENFIVYKVFVSTTERGGTSRRIESKNSYRFKIDKETLSALIPLHYQNEIGMEITLK